MPEMMVVEVCDNFKKYNIGNISAVGKDKNLWVF
jgi:hypothetical protein